MYKLYSPLTALLLTNRRRWLTREQISDILWLDDDCADAAGHFKLTLNALNAVLEPARPPRTPPFYIRRQGSSYRFCPPDGLWLDVAAFEAQIDGALALIAAGDTSDAALDQLSRALALYQGEYLGDYLYADWARAERERFASRYLEAATQLAELRIARGQSAQAIELCESILARDPCWEDAYRLLIRAHALQGHWHQALAAYERCVHALRVQLDMAPLPETSQAYQQAQRELSEE